MSIAVVICLLAVGFQPLLDGFDTKAARSQQTPDEIPAAFRDLSRFVQELLAYTDDTNDTDGDSLPDSVELVIGTNPLNPDSDFDRLSDYDEALMGMAPGKADSNDDRFPDYLEVTGVPLDLDSDGLPNAWDPDNDDDGVPDYLDLSPFAKTAIGSGFSLELATKGKPTYLSFQLRTNNPDHMKLIQQTWDWPMDSKGSFMDLDDSVNDIVIIPNIRMDSEDLPSQEDVSDYGITIDGSSAFLPLFPVWEYGNMVALKGRMFFPGTSSQVAVSLDLSLMWRVSGINDNKIVALRSEPGDHLSVQPDASVIADAAEAGDNETFVWKSLGGDRAALLAANGMYLSLGPDGFLSADSGEITPDCEFAFKVADAEFMRIVAPNGSNLTVSPSGIVSATGQETEGSTLFSKVDLGVVTAPTVLATYYEDFMLTGLSAEENFGSTVAVLNGTDRDELIAANLLLAYEFLRNSSNNISDVPDLLADHALTGVFSDIQDYLHQDLAVQAAASTMIPEAAESIQVGETLPILVGIQDAYASVEMSQLSLDYILGNALSIDLTGEPVTVSKLLRSSWFEGGNETPRELYDVMDLVASWGLSGDALVTASALISAWYCGEQTIASVGGVNVDYDYSEMVFVSDTVDDIVSYGIGSIELFLSAVEILDTAYAFCETFVRISTITKTAGQSTWDLFKTTFNSIKSCTAGSTTFIERLGTAMNIIGVIIAVGISLYALFAIGEELGWGSVGTGIAVTYAIITLAYSLALLALAAFGGPVGAVIAAVIAMIDLLAQVLFGFDFLGKFIGWIIDLCTDIRVRSKVTMDFVDSDMSFVDVDGNGIDVGDNVSYRSRLYGNVTITGDGSYSDLVDSYIIPHQVLWAPWGSKSVSGRLTTVNSTEFTATTKSVLYETEAWLRPGIGMVNFPIGVGLYTDYRIYYDDCWWFFGWWCDRESQTNSPSDTQVSHWTTLYFDVLPGSIDEFGDWRALASSDSDGDGLNSSEEATAGTHPWRWDTDGDGLGDEYELQIGSDPTRRDKDGDGLDDRFEHARGYDPLSGDSDNDGLTDFFEYHGWAVNITYRNRTYYWTVNSDPHLNDTDGDGVNDFEEYYCLLNPRSQDTDGDGVQDEVTDYYLTQIEHDPSFLGALNTRHSFVVAVGDDGYVYSGDQYYVVILDPDGVEVGGFATPVTGNWMIDLDCISVDIDGTLQTIIFSMTSQALRLYATDGALLNELRADADFGWVDTPFSGFVLDPNGPEVGMYYMYVLLGYADVVLKVVMNGTEVMEVETTWGGSGTGPGEFDFGYAGGKVDLDAEGYIYISDVGNSRVQKFEPDGTFVTMWGEPGTQDGFLDNVRSITVDQDGNIITFDLTGDFANRLQKWSPEGRWMWSHENEVLYGDDLDVDDQNRIIVAHYFNVTRWAHYMELIQAHPEYVFLDADSDGLTDIEEGAGWFISVTTPEETLVLSVSSDPMAPDTDADGLNDSEEFALLSDPRSIDSDGDGLPDLKESELGTNLTHWDTDGDGLGDGDEVMFGSDPKVPDTDTDGLSDHQEFLIGTDPNSNDTDQDGLDDLDELGFGSDPTNPDTDGDMMFDGHEHELGTDPLRGDTDSDGVDDGYEVIYETNATSGDSDGDGLSDGFEIAFLLSPLSNDTDGDGLNDSRELELGLNPRSTDSDGDGIPDSLDMDYLLELEGEIILAYDYVSGSAELAFNLSERASVRVVDASTLQSQHGGARYIVLVGDPGVGGGAAGGVIRGLLADSGDVLDRMSSSAFERMAVRYGVWNDTQTIVMLSQVHDTDWIRVLGVLKSMRMTVSERGVLVEYLNPRACFMLDQIDTMRTTDTFVWTKLSEMTTFSVQVEKLHDDEVERSLSDSDALTPGEVIMDKYIRIELTAHDPSMSDVVSGSLVKIYYTLADLDMNGDGDADDSEDLNETTLQMFLLSDDGTWVRLSDITDTTGVNTTDVELFGKEYEGYVWANVSGLSMFGIAGLTFEGPGGPELPWLSIILLVSAAAILLMGVTVAVRRRRARPRQPPPRQRRLANP